MASDKRRQVSQTLTQVLLDRKFLPTRELREVVAKINAKFDYDLDISHDHDLDEYIGELNNRVSLLHLKISQTRDEATGERLVVLSNTLASDLSRHPELSEQQMALYRQLVERIASAPDGHIAHYDALCAVSDIANCRLTNAQAEQTIKDLIKQKYLQSGPDERLSLSPVALVELGPYITTLLDDRAIKCAACSSLCLQGIHCRTGNCPAKLHRACAETLAACRLCKKKWKS